MELDRAQRIAAEYGLKLEAFDGGIRIAGGTPGFPADSGMASPGTLETPAAQPGQNDAPYTRHPRTLATHAMEFTLVTDPMKRALGTPPLPNTNRASKLGCT